MEKKLTSEQGLEAALKAQRTWFPELKNLTKQTNHVIARNVLDTDLGRFTGSLPTYDLDQETRDRLLVHARQDAAEALCHASSLIDDVEVLKQQVRKLRFSIVVTLIAVTLLALWPRVAEWLK